MTSFLKASVSAVYTDATKPKFLENDFSKYELSSPKLQFVGGANAGENNSSKTGVFKTKTSHVNQNVTNFGIYASF